jgi:hypothetical protein
MAAISVAAARPAEAAWHLRAMGSSRVFLLGGVAAIVSSIALVAGSRTLRSARLDTSVATSAAMTSAAGSEALAGAMRALAAITPPTRSESPASATHNGIFNFDFEDGELPGSFSQGHVESCPGLEGSRYCLIGTLIPLFWHRNAVGIQAAPGTRPLFGYSANTVVSFDFWVADDCQPTRGVEVAMFNSDKGVYYHHYIGTKTISFNAWSHAELRLVDFVPTKQPAAIRPSAPGVLSSRLVDSVPTKQPAPRSMEEGDSLSSLFIEGGRVGGKPFFVDNIKVTSQSPGDFPAASTVTPLGPRPIHAGEETR